MSDIKNKNDKQQDVKELNAEQLVKEADKRASDSSMWNTFKRRFRRSKTAIAGFILLIIMFSTAIIGPVIYGGFEFTIGDTEISWNGTHGHHYRAQNLDNRLAEQSWEHPLGTDRLGRDVLARVLWGGRVSLAVGFVAMGISGSIGIVMGASAGYFGGAVDAIIMRFTEIVMSFPLLFLLLTILAFFDGGIMLIMVVIGITGWTGVCRLVRAEFLSLRERDFTQAAQALGASDMRIIFKHILPNAMAPLIVSITLGIGGAILTETTLSFLGIGITPPNPSWGNVLNDGQSYLRDHHYLTTYPGIFIFLTILGYNFLGDGLRDSLDPRLKQ
ncbi:ABC transporter permease [Proteinivorax hydrogeniformans]|uniref:ABC transporter permease n=1 Tax=Proteinivorax hydrogeniformans TaxID=1826727 RepID=A0AAU8HSI9_9FIRM